MSANDPLDAVFVTGDESRKLHEEKANNDLSRFIKKMPVEYRARIGNELAQLRATIAQQAAQLEQAREVIRRVWILSDLETSKQDVETDSNAWQIEADTRTWLSADTAQHAQAQQA